MTTAAIVVALFAALGVEYSVRSTPLTHVSSFGDSGAPIIADSSFSRTMELFTGIELEPGNHVEVLANGDHTYPRLWSDLRTARRSVTVQMYYAQPGRVADTLASILAERARAGVRVLLLRDAFGAHALTDGYLDSLRAAGVRVATFRPVHWYALHKAQSRSHIRVVVIDGRIGYTGGFGIADKWLGDGHAEDAWRDTNVRFTGPAVGQLQATFADGWVEATGQLVTGDLFFPRDTVPVSSTAQLAALFHAAPTIGSTPAERFLALSIAGARRRLYITNSYFVPDDEFVRLLLRAARRGVDVRVLTAGPRTDVKTTRWAGRDRYRALLEGGVRIYEYQPTMMHAKTLVADDDWSSIGTMNFDNRSMVFNDESNLVTIDSTVGATMDSLFMDDLRWAKEITLPTFSHRPWWEKVLDRGAAIWSRLL